MRNQTKQYLRKMVMVPWKGKLFYMSNLWIENLKIIVSGVMTKKTSAVILFDGRSGLGKTTLSSQTGCFLNNEIRNYMGDKTPEFTLDNMYWNPNDFITKLENANKGEIIILDESMILSNRSAMSEINRMVIIIMSLIRSKQIIVIFNLNSIFDMDRNLPLHRADVLVHLYAEEDKFAARGRYMVVPAAKGKLKSLYILGKKYYDYSKARPAFMDKFTPFFPFDENEYERRKQKAINTYFESLSNKSNKTTKIKLSRDNAVKKLKKEQDWEVQDLADLFGVDKRTIYRILEESDVS